MKNQKVIHLSKERCVHHERENTNIPFTYALTHTNRETLASKGILFIQHISTIREEFVRSSVCFIPFLFWNLNKKLCEPPPPTHNIRLIITLPHNEHCTHFSIYGYSVRSFVRSLVLSCSFALCMQTHVCMNVCYKHTYTICLNGRARERTHNEIQLYYSITYSLLNTKYPCARFVVRQSFPLSLHVFFPLCACHRSLSLWVACHTYTQYNMFLFRFWLAFRSFDRNFTGFILIFTPFYLTMCDLNAIIRSFKSFYSRRMSLLLNFESVEKNVRFL